MGYIAILQNEKANDLNDNLLELEWKRQQPCLDIINGQTYKIYIGDEINNYKAEVNEYEHMLIEPYFITQPRTGISTSAVLIEIIITNSGNSDIRQIFIKDMQFFVSTQSPQYTQRPFCILGNTLIKIGETKKLIIDIKQELEMEIEPKQQLAWIDEKKGLILPHMELVLEIISVDGVKYDEIISLDSGWYMPLKDDGLILERTLQVINVQVTRSKI